MTRPKVESMRPGFLRCWEQELSKPRPEGSPPSPDPYGAVVWGLPKPRNTRQRPPVGLHELARRAGFNQTYLESLIEPLPKRVAQSLADYSQRMYRLLFGPHSEGTRDQQIQLVELTLEIRRRLAKYDLDDTARRLLHERGFFDDVSGMTEVEKADIIVERLYWICWIVGLLVWEIRAQRVVWSEILRNRILKEQRRKHSIQTLVLAEQPIEEVRTTVGRWRRSTRDFYRGLRESMAPLNKRLEKSVLLDAGILIMKELAPFWARSSKASTASLLLHAFHPDLVADIHDSLKVAYLDRSRIPTVNF